MSNEREQYGTLKSAEPLDLLRVSSGTVYTVNTLGMTPSPAATAAYHKHVARDLASEREQRARERNDDQP